MIVTAWKRQGKVKLMSAMQQVVLTVDPISPVAPMSPFSPFMPAGPSGPCISQEYNLYMSCRL